jgi:hypothetical protein
VFRYSDTAGATDLKSALIRFVATAAKGPGAGAGTCTVSYVLAGNSLSLMDDAATGWQAGTLGAGRLWNSQCEVDLALSSATMNGSDLTLTLAMTFTEGFGGTKNIYMEAATISGASTAWQLRGSWTVIAPVGGTPVAVSMTPGNGAGSSATVVLLYQDTMGATDLDSVRVRFTRGVTGPTGFDSCTVSYNPATNSVSLMNDTGLGWLTATLGTGTLANGQCTLNLAASSASISGTYFLTLRLSISFRPFQGSYNVYMLAKTVGGISTGWQLRGSWRGN